MYIDILQNSSVIFNAIALTKIEPQSYSNSIHKIVLVSCSYEFATERSTMEKAVK